MSHKYTLKLHLFLILHYKMHGTSLNAIIVTNASAYIKTPPLFYNH